MMKTRSYSSLTVSEYLREWLGLPRFPRIAPRRGILDQEYALGRPLGSGRYGTVHLGTSKLKPELGSLAIKRVSFQQADSFVKSQLKLEIGLLEELSKSGDTGNKNVAQLVDAFEDDENVYVVTPAYQGGELFDRIVEFGTFSERDAALTTREILKAVRFCHDRGVVHRDVKPENLLFESKEQDAALVLVDFGMARKFKEGMYMEMECGSPSYVAPEVLAHHYTNKCDMWSVGSILHVLLTGSTWTHKETEEEILAAVRNAKDLVCEGPAWEGVSQEARSLVSELMRVDQNRRPSAEEALRHDFVSMERLAHEDANLLDWDRPLHEVRTMERLRTFNLERKLKKAALRVMAAVIARENRIRDIMASQVPSRDFVAATLQPRVYLDERRLLHTFRKFDVSGDGYIDLPELRELLTASEGVGLNPNVVDEVMLTADTDGDGRISFEEFCETLRGPRESEDNNNKNSDGED